MTGRAIPTHVAPGFDKFCSCRACQEQRRAAADASSNSAAEGECGFIYSPARPPCRLPKGHDGPHIGKHEADAIPNRVPCLLCGRWEGHSDICPDNPSADATRNRVRAWSADYLAGWRAAMTEARGGDWSQEFPDA